MSTQGIAIRDRRDKNAKSGDAANVPSTVNGHVCLGWDDFSASLTSEYLVCLVPTGGSIRERADKMYTC